MAISIFLTLVLGGLLVPTIYCVLNLRHARRSQMPMVFSPVSSVNPWWVLTQPVLLPWIKHLPWGLGAWVRYNSRGWLFTDKFRMHAELGDTWMHVTPFDKTVYVGNAGACQEIFARKEDFVKPIHLFGILGLFGSNVMTVEGHAWGLHRRSTAPAFNERRSALVWKESMRQARDAVSLWSRQGSLGTQTTHENAMTLAFHVLANTGFGTEYSFDDVGRTPADPKYTMTWSKASNLIRENMLVAVTMPGRLLGLPFVPNNWAKAGRAMTELKQYMIDILEKEQENSCQGKSDHGKLLGLLVRVSNLARSAQTYQRDPPIPQSSGLSTSDILGNLYVFSLAGHETTGNALTHAIYLLAAHPEIQTWVQEEIDQECWDSDRAVDLGYESFPRFKRCLAIMLETLRLFPSVIAVPKYTREEQKLCVSGRMQTIPKKALVILNITAIHTHPTYWGEDSLVWRPSRWIESPTNTVELSDSHDHNRTNRALEQETLRIPKDGTFFPWSDGPRVCPGKRYSQVEFVAVLSTLLRHHHVGPTQLAGESKEGARARVLSRLADCRFALTLHMRDPNSVAMHWSLRQKAVRTSQE